MHCDCCDAGQGNREEQLPASLEMLGNHRYTTAVWSALRCAVDSLGVFSTVLPQFPPTTPQCVRMESVSSCFMSS